MNTPEDSYESLLPTPVEANFVLATNRISETFDYDPERVKLAFTGKEALAEQFARQIDAMEDPTFAQIVQTVTDTETRQVAKTVKDKVLLRSIAINSLTTTVVILALGSFMGFIRTPEQLAWAAALSTIFTAAGNILGAGLNAEFNDSAIGRINAGEAAEGELKRQIKIRLSKVEAEWQEVISARREAARYESQLKLGDRRHIPPPTSEESTGSAGLEPT